MTVAKISTVLNADFHSNRQFLSIPRDTHLLEFGYTHRSGKYVGPRPFMRPAYDMFTPKMLEDIKEIISKGN